MAGQAGLRTAGRVAEARSTRRPTARMLAPRPRGSLLAPPNISPGPVGGRGGGQSSTSPCPCAWMASHVASGARSAPLGQATAPSSTRT